MQARAHVDELRRHSNTVVRKANGAFHVRCHVELGPQGLTRTLPSDGALIDTSLGPSDYFIIGILVLVVGVAAFSVVPRSTGSLEKADSPQLSGGDLPVAVLPFTAEGSEEEVSADLVDGFVGQLRDQLNDVLGIRTASRFSSNAFRNAQGDIRTIASQLGVQVVVVGNLSRSGGELCTDVELIEGATGLVRPSGRHELCNANLVALQQSIATRIARSLLPNAERVEESVAAHTQVESAQEARLLADAIYNRVRDDDLVDVPALDRAIDLYRQAVALDPSAAIAHARLASALLYRGEVSEARESLFNALERNPDLSDVQATFGDYYYAILSDNAGPAWRRALDINENNADALEAYAQWLWVDDDAARPMPYFQRAIELDPLRLGRYARYGEFLGLTGRRDEALKLAEQVLDKFPNERGYRVIARINEVVGRLDEAIAWALKARASMREGVPVEASADLDAQLAELYARIGDFESAKNYEPVPGIGQLLLQRKYDALIEKATALMFEPQPEHNALYILAFAQSATGDVENAVYLLRQAGLPDTARGHTRESITVQAMVVLIAGLYATGNDSQARNLAAEFVDRTNRYIETGGARGWWNYLYPACALAGVHRNEDALARLERLPDTVGLPFYPLLRDGLCFSHLQNNARYRAAVEHVEAQMAGYREGLPEALRAHGLAP